ncbi:hypothetical protein C1645_760050 [Glomus cerebriforme]|uniref:Uncharacterized protein n=1 Tax=Glomus cerebriforme TaxID=658196 RepID=A0A397T8A8_9GLOM|nr:hypothetical protein C1645_760050 [Glomus cerebriforme]
MRKAFAFLASSINKFSSEETKVSTQTTPDIQKEKNKSQIITSNTKREKSSQNKINNTNENSIKKNNNNINSLRKIKENNPNDLKKLTLKKSPSELKKLELTRKTSSKTASSATVSTLHSSNRQNKLSVIKNNDSDSDDESKNTSETNSDNEEEEEDDDHIPLGLRFQHSRFVSSNYHTFPSLQRNQEDYDDDIQTRNHNYSMAQNPNVEKYHYSSRNLPSPVPTTPPLIHTSREFLPHHLRERRFSSSTSSSSSASEYSNGSRYYRNSNANILPNSSLRNNSYSYRNEYEYNDYYHNRYCNNELYNNYDKNQITNISDCDIPFVSNTSSIERIRRISLNTLPPHSKNSKMSSDLTRRRRSNFVVGANPPLNKYQKEATKKMSTAEYHKFQQEMVTAQYLKYGINPIIDDSISIRSEPTFRNSTLTQVQSKMVNMHSTRSKHFSLIDSDCSGYSSNYSSSPPVGKSSYTKTISHDYDCNINNGDGNNYHKSHSESNARFSTQHYHHYHNIPLHLQQQPHYSTVSFSSSGFTNRRSNAMFNSNINSSRSSTSSSINNGKK